MKHLFIRVLLLMLVLALSASVLLSCKRDPEPTTPQDTTATTGDSGNGDYDANGYLKDHLPADLNYDEDILVLGWNTDTEGIQEFGAEGSSADEIDLSIFTRDESVQDRLGVTLKYTVIVGSNSQENNFMQSLQNVVSGGDYFDFVGAYTRTAAICAAAGLYRDLGDIDGSYLDFEMPWWNQSLIEETSIGDTFYLCTGDISPLFIQMVYCIYFNADLFRDYGLDSPYDLVASNEWTLERMISLGKGFYQDENHNQEVDAADVIPMVGAYWDWPALLHGCDVPWIVRDETGTLTVNPECYGEKGLDVMEQLLNFVQVDSAFVGDGVTENFVAGNSLMLIAHHGTASRNFREVSFEYGCVPTPKYDSDQSQYYSTVRQPISMFGIPSAVPADRLAMDTAVMEALASAGYRTTTPVVFDKIMQYQTSASPEMTEMLALIRKTQIFDFGRIYTRDLGSYCDEPGAFIRDNRPWTEFRPQAEQMQTLLDEFIRKIQTGTYQ